MPRLNTSGSWNPSSTYSISFEKFLTDIPNTRLLNPVLNCVPKSNAIGVRLLFTVTSVVSRAADTRGITLSPRSCFTHRTWPPTLKRSVRRFAYPTPTAHALKLEHPRVPVPVRCRLVHPRPVEIPVIHVLKAQAQNTPLPLRRAQRHRERVVRDVRDPACSGSPSRPRTRPGSPCPPG